MPAVLTVKIEDRLKASAESLKKSVEEIGIAAQKVVSDSATKLDFKLIALGDHAGMLGKKLQETFSLESALRSFSSGLDLDIAKMREAGASAQELQDALAKKAVVDVDLSSVTKLSQAFQGIIEKTRQDFNRLLATGDATQQAFASQGLKQKVESVATGAASVGVRQVRDDLRAESQPRDRDRADRTAEARRLAQESAINARRSSSEAQRAAGAEREMAEINRQIKLNEGLASSNAEVAKSLVVLKQQLQDKDDQMRMSLALAERYGKQSDMDRTAAESLVKAGIAKKSRPYVDNQFEEQERAKREAASRGVSAGTTEAQRAIAEQRRNLQGLRQEIAAAQATAEQTLARSNKMFAQAGQMQVQISDLRSYIEQLERIKKPTVDQVKQVEDWKRALEDLVLEQERLRQAAEKTASAARTQTGVSRLLVGSASGNLPDADATRIKARQATLEVGAAATAAKNLRLETRANAESLGLVGRFLDGVGDKAQRNRKILIDIAQAYLINTRAGNEAFNAIQRAAASGGTGGLARLASSPVALPALLGTIVAVGAATAAYKGNERAMRDLAAAGDAAAEGGLRKAESRSMALKGSFAQLLTSMRQGTDQTTIFGSAFRFLASTAETAKGGISSLLLTLAGARGSGQLAAELYESRRLGREQAYETRKEQRGRSGSVGASLVNDSSDLRNEIARVQGQIKESQDGKFIREVLNPRLVALEGRVSDLKSQEINRAQKATVEVAKLVQTEAQAKQEIDRLTILLKSSKGAEADKVLADLAAYRDRIREIREDMLKADTANRMAWRDVGVNRELSKIKGARSTEQIAAERAANEAEKARANKAAAEAAKVVDRMENTAPVRSGFESPDELAVLQAQEQLAYDRAVELRNKTESERQRIEKEYETRRLAADEQERALLNRREDADISYRQQKEQARDSAYSSRLKMVREKTVLEARELDLTQQINAAVRGSAQEQELINQRASVRNRMQELALDLVQAEAQAWETVYQARRKAAAFNEDFARQKVRDQDLGQSERASQQAQQRGGVVGANGQITELEIARQTRLLKVEREREAIQQALANTGEGPGQVARTPEEVQRLEQTLDQATQESNNLRQEIEKARVERIEAARQKAETLRLLATNENEALKARQFDLGEKRLERTAGKDNMGIETARERRQLMTAMQAEMDKTAEKAKEAADAIERLESAGEGASNEARQMRIELERQAQLAADIAQRMEQQRNAEREMLLIVRAKEQEKRDAAAKEAMGILRAAGRLDPLTALGRSINQQQVGRQVLADRRGEVQRLIGEGMSPEDARRQVFKRQVSDEEQLNAKQRLGQGRIDELERRGAISQQTASQLREQLNAEAEGIRQQIRLRVATEDLTRAIRGVNKLGPNQAPIEGANPNKVQGLLGDIADDPRKKERRQAFQEQERQRQVERDWMIGGNRRRRVGDPVEAEARRQQLIEREEGYKARAQELLQGGGRRQMPQAPAQGQETAQASTDAISTMFQYLQQTMAADVEQAKILEAMTSQYQGLLQALSNQASTTRGKAARSIS